MEQRRRGTGLKRTQESGWQGGREALSEEENVRGATLRGEVEARH
jgi:hypothetical protein